MWESPAVTQYDEGISEDSRRVDMDGLEDARCAALIQSVRYLEGIRRYHDRNVNERSFNVGDSVLRHIPNMKGLHKLSSPWEGPFSVSKMTGPGSYRLQTLEGKDISNSWNFDQLSRFYAQSFDYSMGPVLYDYYWTPCCKRPFGPGTSLPTTLLQDPASTATNGSWAI
jgi:hypothetical protein